MEVEKQYGQQSGRTLSSKSQKNNRPFEDNRTSAITLGNLVNAIQQRQVNMPSAMPMQLMQNEDLLPYQRVFINQYSMVGGWSAERLNELIVWASEYKQITNILGKMSYDEWNSIREAYADSSRLGNKIHMPDKQLDPELSPQGKKPAVEQLRTFNSYWAKKANPVHPDQSLLSLITHQRKYETILSALSKEDGTAILDSHRTMGIELEFAQYGGPDLGAHTELAVSNDSILKEVPGQWVLETDNNRKLEIGVPPVYVIDKETGGINIDVISSIRGIVKTALETARDKYKDKGAVNDFITEMPNQGLGKNWSKKAAMPQTLEFKGRTTYSEYSGKETEVKPDLGLHSGHKENKYMYEQINLSMTADEIAENIEKQKKHEEGLPARPYDWLGHLANQINVYLDSKMSGENLSSANILLSKGLAGIGALLDIRSHGSDGVASSVKEIFGIWIKDNTPNLVVSAVMGNRNAYEQLSGFTNDTKKRGKPQRATRHARDISEMIIEAVRKSRNWYDEDDGKVLPAEKSAIRNEVKATLVKIYDLIPADEWITNPSIHYGAEPFDGIHAGLGVRKDTFVNIPSGESRKLHLAEVRSDWTIDKFTADHKTE